MKLLAWAENGLLRLHLVDDMNARCEIRGDIPTLLKEFEYQCVETDARNPDMTQAQAQEVVLRRWWQKERA